MSSKFIDNPTGDFAQDFGFLFGDQHKFKLIFAPRNFRGKDYRPKPDVCPTDVPGYFDTPSHVENDVRLNAGNEMLFGGDRVLIVADHPNPEIGDEGIVGVRYYLQGQTDGMLSMFVNDTATDPAPPWTRDGSRPEMYQKPRTTWLKPSTRYYWRLYRLVVQDDGKNPPLFLEYYGTSPADGQEIPLLPPHMEAMSLDLHGVPGYWIPKEEKL